jgi:hypothetical protein
MSIHKHSVDDMRSDKSRTCWLAMSLITPPSSRSLMWIPLMFRDRQQHRVENGAESVESRQRPDRLANRRVVVLCAPPFGVSRRSHALNRDGVLDQDDARRRSCGFPALSGRVRPCGALGKMHRFHHSRHRLESVGGESLADAKTASGGEEPQVPGDRPRQLIEPRLIVIWPPFAVKTPVALCPDVVVTVFISDSAPPPAANGVDPL